MSIRWLILCGLLLQLGTSPVPPVRAEEERGRSIGRVSTAGELIVVELDQDALGAPNLFDLAGRTLRFTPRREGYRVESGPLRWEDALGPEVGAAEVTLRTFAFPFSGRSWRSFRVGATGALLFGAPAAGAPPDPYGRTDTGVTLGRFDPLAEAAATLLDQAPLICVFLKPRLSGSRHVMELADRVVVTWELTEPFGGLLDYGWFATTDLFQAVLHRDGSIDMSYRELAARDGIVGVYPRLAGRARPLATLAAGTHPPLPPPLDVQRLRLAVIDGALLRATIEMRGQLPPEGDRALVGLTYRVRFTARDARAAPAASPVIWTIAGATDPDDPHSPPRYLASGPGLTTRVTVHGSSLSVEGALPPALRAARDVAVSVEVASAGLRGRPVEAVPPHAVRLAGLRGPEVHLSSLTRRDGPFPAVYEAFHHLAPPRPRDLACTVLAALGDRFDFLAYYADFQVDSQEASSPSDGPGAPIQGIGTDQHDAASWCTAGRLKLAFQHPIWAGANEMQERPPRDAPAGSPRDLAFHTRRLAEASPDGRPLPYDYAMSHLGHEFGHIWSAYVSAKVGAETVPLGPWPHWSPGLHAPAAFPYQLPIEASTLGGGVWQDNLDGTYTLLRDGWFVPATGYSHLDLYLMGLISAAEVPDFFLLKDLTPSGRDANGHPIFKAQRTRISIQDVIAAEGPRQPDVDHSQRTFNTGIVLVVEHNACPTPALLARADGIRRQWIDFWRITTGRRAEMTTTPR